MVIKISKNDMLWGYYGVFLSVAINLLTLPLILKYLTVDEVGLWYSFVGVSQIVVLFDFGFGVTISRNITYAYSGASSVSKKGLDNSISKKEPNYNLLLQIIWVSKKIYMVISSLALIMLSTIGYIYVLHI